MLIHLISNLQLLIHLLVAKKNFIDLKAEVDKLDNNELVNVPTGLNDLKTKVDDLELAS